MPEKQFDTHAIKQHFSRSAQHYDQQAKLQKQVLLDTVALAAAYWEPGYRIADIGSGTGMLPAEVQRQGRKWHVIGCDMAYGMCRYAASKGYAAINAEARQLPFPANSFDGVFSSLMLQWIDAPEGVFHEIYRILKPGGYAVVTTFASGSLDELQQAFLAVDNRRHISQFGDMNRYGASASSAGFAVKKIQQKTHREYYTDTMALMRSIRSIGASHKPAGVKRAALSRRQLAILEEAYRSQFMQTEGLPVTWKILTLVLHKKE